jgi:hypothetical protein
MRTVAAKAAAALQNIAGAATGSSYHVVVFLQQVGNTCQLTQQWCNLAAVLPLLPAVGLLAETAAANLLHARKL